MNYYEVYKYKDPNKGWGHSGFTFAVILCSSKDKAWDMAIKTAQKHGKNLINFKMDFGVREISKKEAGRLLNPRTPYYLEE